MGNPQSRERPEVLHLFVCSYVKLSKHFSFGRGRQIKIAGAVMRALRLVKFGVALLAWAKLGCFSSQAQEAAHSAVNFAVDLLLRL